MHFFALNYHGIQHHVVLITILLILQLAACSQSENSKQTISKSSLPSIRLGTTQAPPSWLIHIAEFKGYFKEQGLNVEITRFKSGKRALKGLFAGKVDIATTAEGPVVFNSFKRNDFSIIATIGQSTNDNVIVARKDRGILKPSDISGKILATQGSSAAHYFLHLFILKQQLTEQDVRQMFMKINKLPEAIAAGKADAIATREPFVSEAMELLGDKGIIFESPCLYTKTFNLAVFNSYLDANPEILIKFLKALLQAEKFVQNNPEQAIMFFENNFKLARHKVVMALKFLDLRLVLQQSLFSIMQDEAHWVVSNKLVNADAKDTPYFLNYINLRTLKKVNRSAVSILNVD